MGSPPSSLPVSVLHVHWAPCLGTAFVCRGAAEFHFGMAGVCVTAPGNTMQELTVNVGKRSTPHSIIFTTRKANWKLFYFLHIYSPKGQVSPASTDFFSVWEKVIWADDSDSSLPSVRILLQWTFLDRSCSKINTSAILAHVQEFLQLRPISLIVPLFLAACVLLKAYPKYSIFWDALSSVLYLIKPREGSCQWFLPSALLQKARLDTGSSQN